ncbi:putative peptidase [Magnetospirillum sp. LM-5]|uniref:metalloprotease TldD n=1 Tax=Magnetospirillum sp. LM-5 TaxID=2681466 RepID=UPI001385FF33|nr:metalloprotease TldD [Magnetospirillum sp. LM-5]CAA7616511.1 putative peptidase [Magnetospirillum sp. LM-5]
MPHVSQAQELFFTRAGMDEDNVAAIVAEALAGTDDGELFLEYRQSESVLMDDRQIKSANFDTTQGFGLRSVVGEAHGYAHGSVLSEEAIRRGATTVKAVRGNHSGTMALAPVGTNASLYTDINPLVLVPFEAKVKLLEEIDAYARREPRIKQVSASLSGSWQAVFIQRADGSHAADIRPLVRLSVSVVLAEGDRMETGGHGIGGRVTYGGMMDETAWRHCVDEAIRQASVNLASIPAPAGEMSVVLGPGWPGVMLHEAVGHGLEGDFNRKGTSAFSGKIGQRVAAKGVTVVDDGTLPDRRGSITIDDEGTASGRTVLIEDGILVGYLQDRLNARLTGVKATGNGRRQSYAHAPIPRMTNTFMEAGALDPAEILASVEKGIYAVNFGGGQVDITSGKFVFAATEAYLIENGKIGAPVKGATLIGNGPDALTRVTMIGNDLQIDPGIGTCGKDGQGVPVGVGQPTLRLDGLTVGGTAV